MVQLCLKATVVSARLGETFFQRRRLLWLQGNFILSQVRIRKGQDWELAECCFWNSVLQTHFFLHQLPLLWLSQVPGVACFLKLQRFKRPRGIFQEWTLAALNAAVPQSLSVLPFRHFRELLLKAFHPFVALVQTCQTRFLACKCVLFSM